MADFLDRAARSERMRRVRQLNTAPELALRRELHALGLRYRLHPKQLPGRPDLVFPAARVALFVHGCFWHGHVCSAGRAPASNVDYRPWFDRLCV
ncbi:MAG: very short patch repair endonuclease [Burkholderiales bacterium]